MKRVVLQTIKKMDPALEIEAKEFSKPVNCWTTETPAAEV